MNKHVIDGIEVEVSSIAMAKHLWITIDFLVSVRGGDTFHSPKHLEGFNSVVEFNLGRNNPDSTYELRTVAPVSYTHSKYKLFKDGVEICKGTVRAKNWFMFYGLIVLFGVCVYGYFKIT
jgi:hypothetical protein